MLLYAALDTVMPRFRQIYGEFGLTEQQWRVLRVLWERERVAMSRLADITLISPPSLAGVVDRMAAGQLVRRERCEHDRRVVHIVLAPAGRRLEHQVVPLVDAAYRDLEASLPPRVWRGLIEGLGALGGDGAGDGVNGAQEQTEAERIADKLGNVANERQAT
ncbi:MAG: MarR family transcriptional regulator [Pseudomonadota bacterium]